MLSVDNTSPVKKENFKHFMSKTFFIRYLGEEKLKRK